MAHCPSPLFWNEPLSEGCCEDHGALCPSATFRQHAVKVLHCLHETGVWYSPREIPCKYVLYQLLVSKCLARPPLQIVMVFFVQLLGSDKKKLKEVPVRQFLSNKGGEGLKKFVDISGRFSDPFSRVRTMFRIQLNGYFTLQTCRPNKRCLTSERRGGKSWARERVVEDLQMSSRVCSIS